MKKEYYEVRGWDAQGRPTAELVRELGLGGYATGL
jgi:aldehyde:ferredoxin oxidoreductase